MKYFQAPGGAQILLLQTNVRNMERTLICQTSTKPFFACERKFSVMLYYYFKLKQYLCHRTWTVVKLPQSCGIQSLSCRVSPPTHDEERGTQFSDVVNATRTMVGQQRIHPSKVLQHGGWRAVVASEQYRTDKQGLIKYNLRIIHYHIKSHLSSRKKFCQG